MPETTKTYADMEILQGANYEIQLTLDGDSTNNSYLLTISKDYTGATDFGGRTDGDGTSANPYRTQITEANVANRGRLSPSDNGANSVITIKLYAEWTEKLDDKFDGKWELVEKDNSNPSIYTRIAQGDIYVNNSTSRWDTVRTITG